MINNAKAQTTANYFHLRHMILFEKHKAFRFMAPVLLNEVESKCLVGIPICIQQIKEHRNELETKRNLKAFRLAHRDKTGISTLLFHICDT
jgi:hypothetical protein